jgi:hypothetical protein
MKKLTPAQAQAAQARADRRQAALDRQVTAIKEDNQRINQMYAAVASVTNAANAKTPIEQKVHYKFAERKAQLIAERSDLLQGETPVYTILHEEWMNALLQLQPKLDRPDARAIHPIYPFFEMIAELVAPGNRQAAIDWDSYANEMKAEFGDVYKGTYAEAKSRLNPVMDQEQAAAFRSVVSPRILEICRRLYHSVK